MTTETTKSKIEMMNETTRKSFFVMATHIKTLNTSQRCNATIYRQSDGRYILEYDNNGRSSSSAVLGHYISGENAAWLIDESGKGSEVDEMVFHVLN